MYLTIESAKLIGYIWIAVDLLKCFILLEAEVFSEFV
jgi:hypothetical protein